MSRVALFIALVSAAALSSSAAAAPPPTGVLSAAKKTAKANGAAALEARLALPPEHRKAVDQLVVVMAGADAVVRVVDVLERPMLTESPQVVHFDTKRCELLLGNPTPEGYLEVGLRVGVGKGGAPMSSLIVGFDADTKIHQLDIIGTELPPPFVYHVRTPDTSRPGELRTVSEGRFSHARFTGKASLQGIVEAIATLRRSIAACDQPYKPAPAR